MSQKANLAREKKAAQKSSRKVLNIEQSWKSERKYTIKLIILLKRALNYTNLKHSDTILLDHPTGGVCDPSYK